MKYFILTESEAQPNKSPAGDYYLDNPQFGNHPMEWQRQMFWPSLMPKGSGINQYSNTQFHGHCSCGKAPRQDKRNRISGGGEAAPNQFPWLVRIVGGCPRGKVIIVIFIYLLMYPRCLWRVPHQSATRGVILPLFILSWSRW